jgi:hypothetical protein
MHEPKVARAAAIETLTKLVDIPPNCRAVFTAQVVTLLEMAQQGATAKRLHNQPKTKVTLKQIGRHARELNRAIRRAINQSSGAIHFLMAARPSDQGPTITDFAGVVDEFAKIADGALGIVSPEPREDSHRGRRRGFRPHYEFSFIVGRLMMCVAECGGQDLAFGKKNQRDTLDEALKILRPSLPHDFFPQQWREMLPRITREWSGHVKSKKFSKKSF